MKSRRFKVRTSWVTSNAFCVRVEERRYKTFLFFFKKLTHYYVYEYASWETFMEIMWQEHMLSGESLWEIDTKI